MATKNVSKELAKKRFQAFGEAAISFALVEKVNLNLVKALVEAYNQKFKTNFWIDEKRKEIIHAGLVREGNYSHFSNLRELLERRGFSEIALCESVASHTSNLQRLMESELEQAEIVLAAQSIGDRLQKMVEDLAGMMAEDVLPIADQMKVAFGTEYAEKWQSIVKDALENGFNSISEIRGTVSNANAVLERSLEGSPAEASDMASFDKDEDSDADLDLDSDDATDDDIDDLLGGSDAASGEDEPLGRAKRESVERPGKKILEKKSLATMGGVNPDGSHSNRLKSDPRHPKNKGVSARPGFVGEKVNEVAPLVARAVGAAAGSAVTKALSSESEVTERNAFIDALNKAVDADKDEFKVDGKKFKITDKAAKTFEELIHEHEDYIKYVQPWREKGYSIYVSRPHEGALMFEVEKDGKEVTIYEPETGDYHIDGRTDINFNTLDAAIRYAFALDSIDEVLEPLEEDAQLGVGIKVGELVRLSNHRVKNPKHRVLAIKGDKVTIARDGDENNTVVMPLGRIKRVKKAALDHHGGLGEDVGALADKTVDAITKGAKAAQSVRRDPRKEKAERDLELAMKRNPALATAVSSLMQEALVTIKEDIKFGINESRAIKNASLLHNVSEAELKKVWSSK